MLQLGDRYVIERELGRGGMAVVYLARDVRHGRPVALKVLRDDVAAAIGSARFLREIETAARLSHPNILAVHDSGNADGRLFFVMPYVAGESLRQRLRRDGRLPIDEAVRLLREVTDAVDYAHREGVVHRDLKPENILLHQGHATVADFGIARPLATSADAALTKLGTVVGTPGYMSPEQAAGQGDIDGRSDIYGLGCVLFEALTGHPASHGDGSAETRLIPEGGRVPDPRHLRPDIDAALAQVVRRALAPERRDRFQTALALAEALALRRDAADGADRALVVLPFANLSPDPDTEYFSDGLTEEITADLSKVRALRVISNTSARRLKGTDKDVQAIGRELNVRYVLEGSVRRAGRSLRVTARLVDARRDEQLWAEKYNGTIDDVFDVQERISRQIVHALDITLSAAEDRRIASRPLSNLQAYDCYLQARQEIYRITPESLDRAMVLLDRALAIEGDNPLILATMGYAAMYRLRTGVPNPDAWIARAEACVERVFALDPESAAGHGLKGNVGLERGRLAEAVASLRHALTANAGDADALMTLTLCYVYAGRVEAARAAAADLCRVDPLAPMSWAIASVAEWADGRFTDAVELAARGTRLDAQALLARWLHGYALAIAGRLDEAEAEVAALYRDHPEYVYIRQLRSLVFALHGDRGTALAVIDGIPFGALDHHFSFHFAECFAAAGDDSRALDLLEQAVRLGFGPVAFIEQHNPWFGSLRTQPRFAAVVALAAANAAGVIDQDRIRLG